MPLIYTDLSVTTQYQSSWDTYIRDSHATTNYSAQTTVSCGRMVSGKASFNNRVILAFDLSDLAERKINTATLTMKTRPSSTTTAGTENVTINLLDTSNGEPVFDEVTWNNLSSSTAWQSAGGDIVSYTGSASNIIAWPKANNTSFTSADIGDVIKNKAGSMCYLILKTPESQNDDLHVATSHNEGSASIIADTPILNINYASDHRLVFKRREMTKYMNKAVGIKGKSSVPSLG